MIQSLELVRDGNEVRNGEIIGRAWAVIMNGTKIGRVTGSDLETIAMRSPCHEMRCAGCMDGYGAEAARTMLAKNERHYWNKEYGT